MRRLENSATNPQISAIPSAKLPNLHADATNRLRQAISKNAEAMADEMRNREAVEDKKLPTVYNCLGSTTDRYQSDRFSDLGRWPTPGDTAAV